MPAREPRGGAATFTGSECQAWAGGWTGDGVAIQGNILAGPQVVEAMAQAYVASNADLGHRLLAALVALTAASLGVSIFVCNPTTGAVDGACTCAKVRFYPDENVTAEDCPVHNPHRH